MWTEVSSFAFQLERDVSFPTLVNALDSQVIIHKLYSSYCFFHAFFSLITQRRHIPRQRLHREQLVKRNKTKHRHTHTKKKKEKKELCNTLSMGVITWGAQAGGCEVLRMTWRRRQYCLSCVGIINDISIIHPETVFCFVLLQYDLPCDEQRRNCCLLVSFTTAPLFLSAKEIYKHLSLFAANVVSISILYIESIVFTIYTSVQRFRNRRLRASNWIQFDRKKGVLPIELAPPLAGTDSIDIGSRLPGSS